MVNKDVDDDGFRLVINRKKQKYHPLVISNTNRNHCPCYEDKICEQTFKRKFDKYRGDVLTAKSFQHTIEIIKNIMEKSEYDCIKKLICLGLGSFSMCSVALQQFIYITEIRDLLNIEKTEFYDPIFTTCEKEILNKYNLNLGEENLEGKYPINDSVTLLYFPHCNNQMTNNFLWRNWNREALLNSILICNSFERIKIQYPERILRPSAKYVLRMYNYTTEYPLSKYDSYEDVFNDTSIHIFEKENLPKANDNFWRKGKEPSYHDSELITTHENKFKKILSIESILHS